MPHVSGNPTWVDYPSTATLVSAAALENMELADDAQSATRTPAGALTTATSSTTVTPNALTGLAFRYTATGALTVNTPTGGTDTQRLLLEITASGADRVITFASGFEVSQAVPGRVFTVLSGTWGYFAMVLRGTTWRLVSAEPQTAITVPTLPAVGMWLPADHGWLTWTVDPINVDGGQTLPSGNLFGSMLRLDTAQTVSNIIYYIYIAGVGLTASRSFAGLWNAAGTLIASTADQSSLWTSTGVKSTAVVTPVACPAGDYFVGFISQAATTVVGMAASAIYPMINTGRTTSAYRGHQTATTYNSLPTPRPAATGTANVIWCALS